MTLAEETFRGAVAIPRELPISAATPVSVSVKDVAKRYGGVTAVEDVSFRVARGSFTTLLGPSGSGKTTILRMIAGFVFPSAGEIMINDRLVSTVPPYKRSIGVVFQSLALFPHLTVAENVAYPLKCRRFDRRIIPDLVSEYLRLVQLSGYEKRRIDDLSGGQRQRVAIARALVYKPDILLLDEPLAALDKKLREEIQMEFRRIQSELRVTTINVTHDQREALVMSDEIVVLDGGHVQQKGAPAEIYRRPANRFVAGFIGHTNVMAGSVDACGDGAMITIDCGGMQVTGSGRTLEFVPAPGMQAECALRAERVRIAKTAAALSAFDTCVPAVLRTIAYEGDRVLYELGAGDPPTADFKILRHEHLDGIEAGDMVFLGWNAEDVVVLRCGTAH